MILTATTAQLIICIPFLGLAIFATLWALRQIWHNTYPYRIRQISQRYRDIAALNACDDYTFYRVKPCYEHTEIISSLNAFNSFQFDQAMLKMLDDEMEMFDVMIFSISQNKRNLRLYHDALQQCSPELDRKTAEDNDLSYHKAKWEEQRLIRSIMPAPVLETKFIYTIYYYCPVKKANMTATKVYSLEELMALRRQLMCPGPVETMINSLRRKKDMWQLAEVDFRYNAEDEILRG